MSTVSVTINWCGYKVLTILIDANIIINKRVQIGDHEMKMLNVSNDRNTSNLKSFEKAFTSDINF